MSLSKKENFMLKMIEQNILKLRKIGKRFENEVKLVLLVSKTIVIVKAKYGQVH